MEEILYENVEIYIKEEKKEIIINQIGERFYYVSCYNHDRIFHKATLIYNKNNESYTIVGEQTIYNDHKDSGLDYEKLLCLHPAELIIPKSFFGIKYYKVSGTLKRQLKSRYLCQHKEYVLHERSLLSQIFTGEKKGYD